MRGAAEILDLELLWAQTRGDPGICIAVLDGPVEEEHPCFRGAHLTHLPTTADPACGGGAASSHGTHVASIIFGQHDGPVRGVAPGCCGLIAPIFADEGNLSACSQLDIARAVLQAVEAGAHVINISAGQFTASREPDPLLARAIQHCADRNVLIVAAVGNDGCECIHVPAAASSVLSVGAMDANGAPMDMSNWGLPYRTQGVLAPGTDILGAVPGGGTARKSATSFATPIVSGIVGLLLSLQLRSGRKPDPHGIAKLILETAHPCLENGDEDCRKYLSGRINVPALLHSIQIGEPKMTEIVSMSDSERPIETALAGSALLDAAPIARPPADLATPGLVGLGLAPMPPAGLPAQVRMSDAGIAQLRDLVTPSHGCSCGGQCAGGKECSCGAGGAKAGPTLVYALGTIGFDFPSEARRDSLLQSVLPEPSIAAQGIEFSEHLLGFFDQNPFEAEAVTWTLNLDATPVYAILPAGAYAAAAYDRLRESLRGQRLAAQSAAQGRPAKDGVDLVSLPGHIVGTVRLLSGQVVPAVLPAVRGMHSWSVSALIGAVLGERPDAKREQADFDSRASGLGDFLSRIYFDLRNLGVTPEDRALNYAATNAFQARQVVEAATVQGLDLERITVHKSPICRPDSDCYDVEVTFFNPDNTNVASRVFRFTVDVSDVIPVTIGAVRQWTRRG
ncbi:MAG: PatA/PatG family cyanobactin maturation protease [Microvirga sp.]